MTGGHTGPLKDLADTSLFQEDPFNWLFLTVKNSPQRRRAGGNSNPWEPWISRLSGNEQFRKYAETWLKMAFRPTKSDEMAAAYKNVEDLTVFLQYYYDLYLDPSGHASLTYYSKQLLKRRYALVPANPEELRKWADEEEEEGIQGNDNSRESDIESVPKFHALSTKETDQKPTGRVSKSKSSGIKPRKSAKKLKTDGTIEAVAKKETASPSPETRASSAELSELSSISSSCSSIHITPVEGHSASKPNNSQVKSAATEPQAQSPIAVARSTKSRKRQASPSPPERTRKVARASKGKGADRTFVQERQQATQVQGHPSRLTSINEQRPAETSSVYHSSLKVGSGNESDHLSVAGSTSFAHTSRTPHTLNLSFQRGALQSHSSRKTNPSQRDITERRKQRDRKGDDHGGHDFAAAMNGALMSNQEINDTIIPEDDYRLVGRPPTPPPVSQNKSRPRKGKHSPKEQTVFPTVVIRQQGTSVHDSQGMVRSPVDQGNNSGLPSLSSHDSKESKANTSRKKMDELPPIWAQSRQEVCEGIPDYFRSYQVSESREA